MKALIHQLYKVFNKYKNGKKRMFIFLGFSNVLITNLVLQLSSSCNLNAPIIMQQLITISNNFSTKF